MRLLAVVLWTGRFGLFVATWRQISSDEADDSGAEDSMDSFIVSGDVEDGEVDDSDQEAGHEDDDAEPRGRDDRPRSRKVRPAL